MVKNVQKEKTNYNFDDNSDFIYYKFYFFKIYM